MTSPWPMAVARGWHPLARVSDLRARPLPRTLMDQPLVLFSGPAGPVVLRDRCPHRAMPLSGGQVRDGTIACPYHGWRFGEGGRCLAVPGSDMVPDVTAEALPVIVRAGLVWTALAPDPAPFPRLPEAMEVASLDRFWWAVPPSRARLLDAIENHLDPAHPHIIHPWIVRSPAKRRPVRVHVRIDHRGAEATYEENSHARGWIPRLFEGHRLRSIGRYHPPTIAEVLFEGSRGLVLSIAVVFVPDGDGVTRPYAHFATPRRRAPAWLKQALLKAFHMPILSQDRRALSLQAESIAVAGKTKYTIGPLDFLGPAIWRFANGGTPDDEEYERTIAL